MTPSPLSSFPALVPPTHRPVSIARSPSLDPLLASRLLLAAMGIDLQVEGENRIPEQASVIVASNHRSFLDPFVLMQALNLPLRTVCHHYMTKIPLLRESVSLLGGIPFQKPSRRQQVFFEQAIALLRARQWVGIFPEGAAPMVQLSAPAQMSPFHRGFAHLALRADLPHLAILPIAIASLDERIERALPLNFLQFFDPSEPLFATPERHPVVLYQRARVLIGRPYWITPQSQQQYQGREAKKIVAEVTEYCRNEIAELLGRAF